MLINSLKIWWLAIRPKTLFISITPVILALSLALHDQAIKQTAFQTSMTVLVILFSALGIQIGTNLYNDAADFEKGADTPQRLGPKRAAQQGWLTAQQIKQGALISFSLAFISGIYLAYIGGWGIIILGLFSIASGYAYTAGPKPIAYSPFGELFVLVFFGLAAVGGSYYLLSQTLPIIVLILSICLGSFAAAILLVNNYRDLDQDKQVNKLTLVFYTGRSKAKFIYASLLLLPFIILLPLVNLFSWSILLAWLSLPLAIYLIKQLHQLEISANLNKLLGQTAQLQLIFCLLLCIGLLSPVYTGDL